MKKLLLSAGLLAASASLAHAQTNVIKTNLVSPLLQTGSLFYEHRLTEKASLNLGVLLTRYQNDHGPGGLHAKDQSRANGFALTAEYRLYPGGKALAGWFVGPYLRYQNYSFYNDYAFVPSYLDGESGTHTATLTTFGGGVVTGHQWIIGRHLSVEPFLGVGYAAGEVQNEANSGYTFAVDGGMRGLELRPGLNVGFAF